MSKDENLQDRLLVVPVDSNGIAIYPTEYRVGLSDGRRWYVVAVNKDYVFATPAELTTAERDAWIKEKPLVRLRPEWLTIFPDLAKRQVPPELEAMNKLVQGICSEWESLYKRLND